MVMGKNKKITKKLLNIYKKIHLKDIKLKII